MVFTLLVLYLLYKAVRWALGRGGGAAPAAEAGGAGGGGEGEGPEKLRGFSELILILYKRFTLYCTLSHSSL